MSGECDRCGEHCSECLCDDREAERQRIVADSPFGIHEALHTCSVLMDTFGERVAEHPAVTLRPAILEKAEEAIERMMDVYQALGRLPEWYVDFASDAAEGIEAPKDVGEKSDEELISFLAARGYAAHKRLDAPTGDGWVCGNFSFMGAEVWGWKRPAQGIGGDATEIAAPSSDESPVGEADAPKTCPGE